MLHCSLQVVISMRSFLSLYYIYIYYSVFGEGCHFYNSMMLKALITDLKRLIFTCTLNTETYFLSKPKSIPISGPLKSHFQLNMMLFL